MTIRLKVAKSPAEIDDALWIRHEVFVVEHGKFGGKPAPDERMMDRFDAIPDVCNVIAYDGDEPIATIRLIKENEIGLPADKYFDFTEYREKVQNEFALRDGNGHDSEAACDSSPVFGSAGMLAVRQPWCSRRDVIRAMYRIAAGVYRSWDVTHVVAVVNYRTASMYRRMGFKPLSEKLWRADIGDHVVPLAATLDACCEWAFGDLPETPLGAFKNSFERLFVRSGETIFREGDDGRHAYIVNSGQVRISVQGHDGGELTLAQQRRGDLFGEFALIDAEPRSATAVATANAELITLDRCVFLQEIVNHPERILQLLKVFTARVRRMDELMSSLVSSSNNKRLEFALGLARVWTIPDSRPTDELAFEGGPADLALSAAADESTATRLADETRQTGELIYSNDPIRFVR